MTLTNQISNTFTTRHFPTLPPQARLWIYQADRSLSHAETERLLSEAQQFVAQWKAHGTQLNARAEVVADRFLLFAVDEREQSATGCSIDASVHFVKQIGQKLGVDWFDRTKVVALDSDGQLFDFDFRQTDELVAAGTLTADTLIFSNNLTRKAELADSWIVPAGQSWLGRYFR